MQTWLFGPTVIPTLISGRTTRSGNHNLILAVRVSVGFPYQVLQGHSERLRTSFERINEKGGQDHITSVDITQNVMFAYLGARLSTTRWSLVIMYLTISIGTRAS